MKGDKKRLFMEKTGKDEAAYYEHSRQVCEKRHFNIRLSALLKCYGFTPVTYLNEKATEMQPQEYMSDSDYRLWLIQDCKCPVTILQNYVSLYHDDSHQFSKEAMIARYLKKFPEASFHRFGDRNLIERKTAKNYFAEEGMPIDVQAMEITEFAVSCQIEPQDIVDFVVKHPKGQGSYKPVTMADQLEAAYYQLTGQKLYIEFASLMVQILKGDKKISDEEIPF